MTALLHGGQLEITMQNILEIAIVILAAGMIWLIVENRELRKRVKEWEAEHEAVDIYFAERDPKGWAEAKKKARVRVRH